MRRESMWISPLVWLAMLGLAFVCGLVVMSQAFETHVFLLDDRALRVSADYGADPRIVQEAQIPPVDSAVISDTVRDLIAEQAQAPLLSMFLSTPTVVASPSPGRTPTTMLAHQPSVTPVAAPVTAVAASPTNTDLGPGQLPAATATRSVNRPTRTPLPTSTPLPTRTPRPTSTATPRPSATPTDVPTATPTDVPTAIPTDVPTAIPTDAPTPIQEAPTAVASPQQGPTPAAPLDPGG